MWPQPSTSDQLAMSSVQRHWNEEIKTYIEKILAMVVKRLLMKMMFVHSEQIADKTKRDASSSTFGADEK